MTDLERVRETARVGDWEAFDAELYAHLKEDARLRKELERSRQDDSEWKATIERTNAENARLREAYRGMGYLREDYARLLDKKWAADREVARLREELDLKDGLLNQAKGELDRLRENRERECDSFDAERESLRAALADHGCGSGCTFPGHPFPKR